MSSAVSGVRSDEEIRRRVADVEALLGRIEELTDPEAKGLALDAVQGLLELYGEGLLRIRESAGPETLEALAQDELVSHLLLLHGLHPTDREARVRRALDEVRPYLRSHGGDVELVAIEGDVARLALRGSCDGCPSSAATIRSAIEEAIARHAPDVDRIEADGAPAQTSLAPRRAWHELERAPDLGDRGLRVEPVLGQPVLFLRAAGTLYAYGPACPACGAALDGATLIDAELSCAACARRYDVRLAGRSIEDRTLHLDPIPLVAGPSGTVRVAPPPAGGT